MAALTRKPNQNKEKPAKAGGGGKRLLLFLLLAVIVGGGLAFGALRFFGSTGAVQAAVPPRSEPVENLDLGDKVVNLANGESGRYLRVRAVLEYPREKKLAEEIKARQPALTEKVLNIFRSKKAEEILPVKNQARLKEEILQAVNSELTHGKVRQVYFTDFLVQ